jgi:hypothetical protein
MIYAGEQGPWRSWMQVLSKNNKTSGEKCYKLGRNPDSSNSIWADTPKTSIPRHLSAYPASSPEAHGRQPFPRLLSFDVMHW